MSPPAPSRSVRVFVAFLAARGAFSLVFLGTALRETPIPWYHPLGRAWSFESRPSDLAIDWFGRTAVALAGGAAIGAAAWFAGGRSAWLGRRAVVLGIARAGGLILLLDFVYFGWTLATAAPSPLPLPPWYCPR